MLPARYRKPQYAFYPARIVARVVKGHVAERDPARIAEATLPWGMPISLRPGEAIGHSVMATGIFDHVVSEALYRLTDAGDVAVDVGANIGYMTSLMVEAVGRRGRVVAIEPNPDAYALLVANAARWRSRPGAPVIETHSLAMSDHGGSAALRVPALYARNQGRASIEYDEGEGGSDPWHAMATVQVRRLDDLIGDGRVGVLKIDVEGHETGVLRGAEGLLAERRVRDVVFEHEPGRSGDPRSLLERRGYTVLALNSSVFRLVVGSPDECPPWEGWEGPSYLATIAPDRALSRLRKRGWALPGIRWGSAVRPR
jgi:FkbM family methyltransferase